jgi:glycerophosphoryl diester phosphodiesterase
MGRWRRTATEAECVSVHLPVAKMTPRGAARVKAAGFQLASFTVNDPEKARELWSWGVDSLFTDRPDLLLAARQGPTAG